MKIPEFCRRLGCSRPDVVCIKETDEFATFYCKTCQRINVFSSPKAVEAAKWRQAVNRHVPKHSWDKPKLTFDLGRSR